MSQTSPVNTATAAGAAAVIAPVVSYVASALHLSLPADVQAAIVIILVAVAHWGGQQIGAFTQQISDYIAAKRAALVPAAPILAPPSPSVPAVVNVSVAPAATAVPAAPPASAQQ